MIRIFQTSFFLLLATICVGQDLPNLVYSTKITTLAYFKKGESKKFHVRASSSKHKKDEKPQENKSEFDMDLKVIDSTENSYRFELRYSNFIVPQELNDLEKELISLVQHYKIIYSTDANGAFEKVENIDELKQTTSDVITIVKKKLQEKLKTPEEKELFSLAFKGYETMMTKDENIENLFLEDILALHGMYGMELKLNEKEEIEIEYPTLNNVPVKGTGTIMLKEINKTSKEAKIEVIEKPNEGEMKNFMEAFFKMLINPIAHDVAFDPAKFTIDCKNEILMFMRLDSGWMRKIIMNNQTTVTYEGEKTTKSTKREYTML